MEKLRHVLGCKISDCLRLLCLMALLPHFLQAQGARRIRVAVSMGNPPYEYLSSTGQPEGFTVDVLRAVAEVEKLDLDIRPMTYPDLRAAFDRNEVDLVTSVVWTEERARTMDFTLPIGVFPYIILAQEGGAAVRTESDLRGKRTLVLARSIMRDYLMGRGLSCVETPSHDASIQGLLAREADCAIVPKYSWLLFAKHHETRGIRPVEGEFYPTKRNFAVHKGDSGLLNKMNEGLFLIQQSGTLQMIHDRHFGALEASELSIWRAFRRTLPAMLPVVSGVGLVILLAWTVFLRRKVRERTAELQQTVEDLQRALSEVRQLSGLIPICAHCKKIRDDQGYWQAVESYIAKRTEATFSHGMCPDCVRLYYPSVLRDSDERS